MQTYHLNFHFEPVPPIMTRGEHVLIVLKDMEGNYVLGAKDIYPEGIYRFVGGGLDGNGPIEGAARELEEELGITVESMVLTELAIIEATIESVEKEYHFKTHLFYYYLSDQAVNPADDLDGVKRLTIPEMEALIQRYTQLSTELVSVDDRKPVRFRWSDYGKLYGPIHQIGLDLTKKR